MALLEGFANDRDDRKRVSIQGRSLESSASVESISSDLLSLSSPSRRQSLRLVRQVTSGVLVVWLMLVASLGWWLSQRSVAAWLDGLAESNEQEARATARVVDRLFTEMVSVANMVGNQADVISLAARYRTDPPGFAELTRQERAAHFAGDPLVRKVGDFMNALSKDLRYARIYMNNMSDDTVATSNWAEPDSIAGMIYSRRAYLMDALRDGSGHSFGIARLLKIPSYFVAVRIDDAHDVPLGSVTVRFDAPDMADYLKGQHIALIVNRQGRVTTAASESFMLRNVGVLVPRDDLVPSKDEEVPGEPLDIRPMTAEGRADQWLIEGRPYLVERHPLINTQYQLLTLAALNQLTPMRNQHFSMAMLLAGLGVVVILLSSYLGGEMVMRRQDERQAAKRTFALNEDLSAALTDAKTKERQKVEVLGYISHDLRAPLATISGYSGLLLADAKADQRKMLQAIQRNVKYQLDLIDELLEYAKFELKPLVVQPVPTHLIDVLDEVCDYAMSLCSQRNNRFRYEPSGRFPHQVLLDGKRLRQVLLNLIANAAKFTHDGLVTLSVKGQSEKDPFALHFEVSDTGIGIDLSQHVDIFGQFQQVQAASGSAGLGLFIAQRIVSAMGGALSVSSVPGQGSTFSFTLAVPIIDAPDSIRGAVAPQAVDGGANFPRHLLAPNAKLSDHALDELASFALNGRLTDVERWVERHAGEADNAPFVALLNDLVERLDFAGICALCVAQQEYAST